MEFLFRDKEINELRRLRWLSEEQYTRTMVLTGIKGVGKTALIRHSLSGHIVLFLLASHKSEGLMVADFKQEIESKLSLKIAASARSLNGLFDSLFDDSSRENFTVVLDQYHLLSIDFLAHLAALISEKKRKTNINLIFVSSDEIASNSLYKNEGSTLFNCIDSELSLKPFSSQELKQILETSAVGFSSQNLYYLYAISGGIPKYVEALISSQDILSEVYQDRSFFLDEGNAILSPILGKNPDVYYSVLEVISRGAQSQAEIESALGNSFNVGGHLAKLEIVYGLVKKSRPVFSPGNSRGVVRYSLTNPFLYFWFRYIEFYRSMLEMGQYEDVIRLVEKRLVDESKPILCNYFREKIKFENDSLELASWWEPSSKDREDLFEIPVVAYSGSRKKTILADVCYSVSEFDKERFLKAVKRFKMTTGRVTGVDSRLFVLEDM